MNFTVLIVLINNYNSNGLEVLAKSFLGNILLRKPIVITQLIYYLTNNYKIKSSYVQKLAYV